MTEDLTQKSLSFSWLYMIFKEFRHSVCLGLKSITTIRVNLHPKLFSLRSSDDGALSERCQKGSGTKYQHLNNDLEF